MSGRIHALITKLPEILDRIGLGVAGSFEIQFIVSHVLVYFTDYCLGLCKATLFYTLFVCLLTPFGALSQPDGLNHVASAQLEGCHFFFFFFFTADLESGSDRTNLWRVTFHGVPFPRFTVTLRRAITLPPKDNLLS